MFTTDVTPCDATYCIPFCSALSASSGGGSGITSSTRLCALSLRMPVGSPLGARTMRPPAGSFVSLVTFAAARASEFASDMWPSSRVTHTGLSGVTESIQDLLGSSPPQSEWSQSPPRIHAPLGILAA